MQDGDQVIAMMHGQHLPWCPSVPAPTTFLQERAGSEKGVAPSQSTFNRGRLFICESAASLRGCRGSAEPPGLASRVGRAEGAFGQGAISLVPKSSAECLIKQYILVF